MDLEHNGNSDSGEGTEQLSMEQLMEMDTSVRSLKEGDIVSGMVVAISNDEVMIDIGFKCEGTVSLAKVTDPDTGEVSIAPGDEVEVYVERIDAMEGRVYLSLDRAARLKIWTVLEDAFKNQETVKGQVIERVKGGLSVDIGIRAFLPGSLVDMRPNRRLEDYIDQEIEARIISFDRRRSNVVLSRKTLLEEEVSKAKDATMSDLEEGQLVSGEIKNITDYGVFVDLGGLDGLLHITDISWGRVGHPNEYFKVGDTVEVVVLRFDREKERVSLGYKQRFEDPWILVPEKYPVGKRVKGEVVSIVDYGAFIALEEGVEGLVHVSEMSWTKKVKNPRSVLEIGQEVDVVVSEVDSEKRRLSLSLRAIEVNPWETVADTYHVGNRIQGIVRNLTDFGAFVEIVPGVDGLVHISDMSWTRRINHPSEVIQKGQEVNAVVTAIDVTNQRISLSMKELMPNEWEEYANSHGVGQVVSGTVTNITDFGVFIELAPGVEGLCHISEIERLGDDSLEGEFTTGQKVRCRILRVDWNESRIGLSMQGVSQEEEGDETSEADGGAAAPVDTAMAAALRAGGLVVQEPEADEEVVAEATDAEETALETAAEEVEEKAPEDKAVETAAEDTEEVTEEAAVETAAEDTEEVTEEAAVETASAEVEETEAEEEKPAE
ncbi:MAG: 30S ribosomal protein S1 [Thermoanaerobaculales bacterium]|nr:30S ribosomal protein S1 [Thermoanaerobaculales bacterium]